MNPRITDPNGFRAIAALNRAASSPYVEEIEGGGMDDGRVFIHLRRGWRFGSEDAHSRSVGRASDVREALADITKCERPCCIAPR